MARRFFLGPPGKVPSVRGACGGCASAEPRPGQSVGSEPEAACRCRVREVQLVPPLSARCLQVPNAGDGRFALATAGLPRVASYAGRLKSQIRSDKAAPASCRHPQTWNPDTLGSRRCQRRTPRQVAGTARAPLRPHLPRLCLPPRQGLGRIRQKAQRRSLGWERAFTSEQIALAILLVGRAWHGAATLTGADRLRRGRSRAPLTSCQPARAYS